MNEIADLRACLNDVENPDSEFRSLKDLNESQNQEIVKLKQNLNKYEAKQM
jgi:hypothetical protein